MAEAIYDPSEHKGHRKIALNKVIKISYLLYEIECMIADGCPELNNLKLEEMVLRCRGSIDAIRLSLR